MVGVRRRSCATARRAAHCRRRLSWTCGPLRLSWRDGAYRRVLRGRRDVRRSSAGRVPSGSTSGSNRCKNFSRAGRVRALLSTVRLHRDLRRYAPVDVLACDVPHLPLPLRSVLVSAFVSAGMYARLRADARARRETRQAVRRSLTVRLLGGGRAPTPPADLNRTASLGVLGLGAGTGWGGSFR